MVAPTLSEAPQPKRLTAKENQGTLTTEDTKEHKESQKQNHRRGAEVAEKGFEFRLVGENLREKVRFQSTIVTQRNMK